MTHLPGQPLLRALAALSSALDEYGRRYMIIGGIAVILHGVARVTNDVDATVWAPEVKPNELLAVLARHGIRPRIPDAIEFAERSQVFLLQHTETATPMELSLAWLTFEDVALANRRWIEVEGFTLPVARVEDLLIYKAIAWRDRDRSDCERLLSDHLDRIDLDRVRAVLKEFAEAIEKPERLREFNRLLSRVRGGK